MEVRTKAKENITKLQAYNKEMVDRKRKAVCNYKEGDFIVIKTNVDNKLSKKFRGPYIIKKILPNDRYFITDIEGFQVSNLPFSSVCSPNNMRMWLSDSNLISNYDVDGDIDESG